MKEGAWISAHTSRSAWVGDHAMWITRAGNAGLLGVSEEAQLRLVAMASPHTPTGRREVLLAAMDAGLIRVRGHGVATTFEFTIQIPDMLQAVRPFMLENFGPLMGCRFNNLRTGEAKALLFKDLEDSVARVQSAAYDREPRLVKNVPGIGREKPCLCRVPSCSEGPG